MTPVSLRPVILIVALACGAGTAGAATAPRALLIEDVTLIDGTGRAPIAHASVLIEGQRISRVERGRLASAGAQRIAGSGKFLVPGLMDVHVHLDGGSRITADGLRAVDADEAAGTRALQGYLYSGVTTIYDAGNNPDFIFALRERERAGTLVSPRIFATGGIVTYPGSHGSFEGATLIDAWPADEPLLAAHLARHPDIVKLTYEERGWGTRPMIPLLPLELLRTLVEYANGHGARTTVHVSGERRARQAIYAGVDTLAHPVIQGPVTDEFVRLVAARRIPIASTLTIGDNYARLAEHPEFLAEPLYQATLAADEIGRLGGEVRQKYNEDRWTWWMKVMTPVAQDNLRRINAAGGIVALGTDQSLGAAVHRELELLVAAGIPARDAIRIGTLNAARFLGREDDMGSIEEGKLADLVLLDADPLQDINNSKRVAVVIKDGRVVDRTALRIPANGF